MPTLIVIGGPNGSGKTTLTQYLKERLRIKSPVINPDEIALNEFGSYSHHISAAKEALTRRKNFINNNNDIAFETTFSGTSEITDIIKAKEKGYTTILYFVTLKSVLDNIIRVEQRQSNAGHKVDNDDIIRRYEKSYSNLVKNISLFDTVYLFDNSDSSRSRVAIFNSGKLSWVNGKHLNHSFYKTLLA